MNLARLKLLTWIAALAAGGLLARTVVDFFLRRDVLERGVTEQEQRAVLDAVDEGEDMGEQDLVDYKQVLATFHNMNWTGREAPKPVQRTVQEQQEKPKVTPIAEILDVVMVQVDTTNPAGSRASIRYKAGADATRRGGRARQAAGVSTVLLHVGDQLAQPWDSVTVKAIVPEGVEFSFADASRAPELVETLPFPNEAGLVVLVPDGEKARVVGPKNSFISESTDVRQWIPDRTNRIGKNEYRLGTRDVAEVEEDYSRILSRDVRYERHRDPRTGQVTGLLITHVAPGSIPEAHGLLEGEVLKSINGHPVTSVNGAIAFVKKEAATTDKWVAVFERQGVEYSRTYYSPVE